MQTLGKPKEVLANFLRKEQALKEGGDLSRIRPAIIVLAGGTAGIQSLGILHALSEYAPNAANVCAGVSAGSANVLAFLGGKTKLGMGVYEHLASANFIEGHWFNPRLKIDYPIKILREGFKGQTIDQQTVYNHRSKFVVFATEYSTGKGVEINAKETKPDIIEAIRASMMVPGVCSGTVHIGGTQYVDGACGTPFPIRNIVKKYRPTDVLVLFNRALPMQMSWIEWYLFPVYVRVLFWMHHIPTRVRENTQMMDHVMAHEIRLLMRDRRTGWSGLWRRLCGRPLPQRKTLRWCIIAPDPKEAISQRTTDRKLVRTTGERSYRFMKGLLADVAIGIKK